MTANEIARAAVAVLIEKKGIAVKLYEVGEENPLTDFYVNATGRSASHVASLADDLVDNRRLSIFQSLLQILGKTNLFLSFITIVETLQALVKYLSLMFGHNECAILGSFKFKISRIVFLQQMLGLIFTYSMIHDTRRTATDVRLNMKFDTTTIFTAESNVIF